VLLRIFAKASGKSVLWSKKRSPDMFVVSFQFYRDTVEYVADLSFIPMKVAEDILCCQYGLKNSRGDKDYRILGKLRPRCFVLMI